MSKTMNANFPGVMRDHLRAVRFRQAGFAALRALALSMTALLIAMIVAMVVDWAVTLFDVRVRILLTSSCLLLASATLWWMGWRPIRRALGWTTAAEQVDQRIPQMEERWRTVASLAEAGDEPSDSLTRAMLSRVKGEAVVMSRLVRPDRVISAEVLKRPMIGLTSAMVALGIFFASNWGQTSVLWQRFWSPTANISATQLNSLTGDVVVPRGTTIEVTASIAGLQRSKADLILKREATPDVEEKFTATPVITSATGSDLKATDQTQGTVTFVVDVDETLSYQVKSGDGRTEWHQIKAIDFPELRDVRLTVTPPAYVDAPAAEKTLIPSRLRAVQGSHLELAIKPQVDLKSLRLNIALPVAQNAEVTGEARSDDSSKQTTDDETPADLIETFVLTRGDDGWYRFEQMLSESFSFTPILVSSNDLQNKNPRVCRVEVIEDHAPVARIVSPNGESSVGADETLEIRFEAHDDHGIATAELVIYQEPEKAGDPPQVLEVRPIPLGDQAMQKHVMSKLALDLKEFGLPDGATISYSVRVTDNRNVNMDSKMPGQQTEHMLAANDSQEPATGTTPDDKASSSQSPDSSLSSEDERTSSLAQARADGGRSEGNSAEDSIAKKSSSEDNSSVDSRKTEDRDNTASHDRNDQDPTTAVAKNPGASDASKSGQQPTNKLALATESPARDAEARSQQTASAEDMTDEQVGSSDPSAKARETTTAESPTEHPADELIAAKNQNRANSGAIANRSGEPGNEQVANTSESQPAISGSYAAKNKAANTAVDAAENGETSPESNSTNASRMPIASDAPDSDHAVSNEAQNSGKNNAGENTAAAMSETNNPATSPGRSTENQLAANQLAANPQSTDQLLQDQLSQDQSLADARISRSGDSGSKGGSGLRPKVEVKLNPQSSESGQQQETDRRRVRIVSMLEAIAKSEDPRRDREKPIREKVVQIDSMLEVIETKLTALYRHETEEALRGDDFRELDVRLKNVEEYVIQLEDSTRETVYEFVGLQMIDISSTHVTPARDAIFIAIRRPDSGADLPAEEALHHIVSARELLQALLKRYDSVAREQQLVEKMDDVVKMYTVYVERAQRLMREAQRNRDPFRVRREMAVVEVDQAYLDRLAEVTRMRRDMMSELARILSDDPRLLSRYLDLIKRRRSSMGNQLAELAARQDQAAQEVNGWLSVDENQRDNYWLQISDLRLDVPNALAKEAQQLADHIEKQLPLVLDPGAGSAAASIETAKQIALDARRCDLAVRDLRKSGESAATSSLSTSADSLVYRISELAAALDQLQFEAGSLDGVSDYIQRRQIEVQALADQADHWSVTAHAVEQKAYAELAGLDQHQIAISTELLRTEMLDLEADLAGQFNDEVAMPQEVINLTNDLQRVMESITHNQSSATFSFSMSRIDDAAPQQELALQGFDEAQKLLNQLRRKTTESLDKITVENPNIADLRDPTLDQFLAELEREPNIEAQLGIPNRPRNVRVLQDAMTWNQNGAAMLGTSSESAMARIQQMVKQRLEANGGNDPKSQEMAKNASEKREDPQKLSDEEKQQAAESEEMQKMLKERMELAKQELERQAADPSKTEEERRRAEQMAAQMTESLKEMESDQTPEQLWRQMVEADQAKALLEALAKGEQVPDEQWNKLMSTLGDGVGQVTGRVPSEDYRRSIEQYQERIRQLTGN